MARIPTDLVLHRFAVNRHHRHAHATVIDLCIVACIVAGFFMVSVHLELAERLAAWVRAYEYWQLDELPLSLLLLSVGLAWFSWRRWRELSAEMTARRQAEELNLHMLAQNRQLAQQLIELQEQERRHLARELHDEFGQCCVAIKVDAAFIAHGTHGKQSAIHASALAISDTADHLHNVLRGMLQRLRPTGLDDFGLATCLQVLIDSWSQRHKVACTFKVSGVLENLDDAINITLYRTVQESLSNIAQHAQASIADVTLHISNGPHDTHHISLNIEDNGIGMSEDIVRQGVGLLGMNERISALGGCMSLSKVPAGGTLVRVVLPLTNARDLV
jgi:glucose-6-phosphate-specific signal transduction histidine kinase